jgi:exosortase
MSDLAEAVPSSSVMHERGGSHPDLMTNLAAIARSEPFVPSVLILATIVFAFWTLIRELPILYFDSEGYYSHGPFMPLTAGYVIYRNWDYLKLKPVKPSYWSLVVLLPLLLILRPSSIGNMESFLSVMLVVSILAGVWFVAGWKWMLGVSLPILYLLLGLPVWSMAIDLYTNPLQLISTSMAFWMLRTIGMEPLRDGTIIHLNHFNLDVGIPCSGLKLIVALSAFTMFFMMIAKLRWWSNLFLAALVVPMALVFNGLRIAMIGFVGETYGDAAGRQFHDYSGFIMLGICFLTFFKIVRLLGWKD